jgi:hypothetical protein
MEDGQWVWPRDEYYILCILSKQSVCLFVSENYYNTSMINMLHTFTCIHMLLLLK